MGLTLTVAITTVRSFFKTGSRINPKVFDKDYLFLKALSEDIHQATLNICGKDLMILDVGSTYRPYESLFTGKYRSYLTIDLAITSGKPDIIALGESLPVASECMDICLCTQVLEHVNNPAKVVSELARVLKRNGILILSTHGVFHYHPNPHDFWRWTAEGLYRVVNEYFDDVVIHSNGGTILLLFHILGRGIFSIIGRKKCLKILQYTIYPLINVIGFIADKLLKEESLPINYLVIAKKDHYFSHHKQLG